MKFWDSSALLPLVIAAPQRRAFLRVLESDRDMVVWWGTPVECSSALARREREQHLSARKASAGQDLLRQLARSWLKIEPTDAVRSTVMRLLRVHELRAADGLQLAAAMVTAEHAPLPSTSSASTRA